MPSIKVEHAMHLLHSFIIFVTWAYKRGESYCFLSFFQSAPGTKLTPKADLKEGPYNDERAWKEDHTRDLQRAILPPNFAIFLFISSCKIASVCGLHHPLHCHVHNEDGQFKASKFSLIFLNFFQFLCYLYWIVPYLLNGNYFGVGGNILLLMVLCELSADIHFLQHRESLLSRPTGLGSTTPSKMTQRYSSSTLISMVTRCTTFISKSCTES